MVGKLLRCQRSQCPPLLPPADSSLGAIHDGEDIQEGFGGRRVDGGGETKGEAK